MIKQYFIEWQQRLKSSTPDFFKTLIRASASLGAISLALIGLGDSIPASIHTLAGYVLAITTTVAVISASTKKNDTTTNK